MMKAAVLHGARDLRVEDRQQPELQPGMVLLRNRRVGVCGSDLHYFEHGYCASFIPDRPFILGHELSAVVAAVGSGVTTLQVGQRVTVNPARSCLACAFCKSGHPNLCRNIIMLGSASTTPPTDGAFAELTLVRADQCHVLPESMDDGIGAMIEPFAVALHAVKRAPSVSGKRVLITGSGTIGLLVAVIARAFGAVLVAVSDVVQERRKKALELGVDDTLDPTSPNLAQHVQEITGLGFDVIFEASGAPPALRQAFDLVAPGGTIVQIGTLGSADIPLPANLVMNREIHFIGSMRYADVFDEAIALVHSGRVNLKPFISHVLPFSASTEAIHTAADKSNCLKVQIEI
ncbi:zinc-dependent alcohol dehydrogenase [Edaphobacter flagellatus]|uniref:zinc-dependent alcohol dehydrogenase n=1 Tax=Edaphobacter flagellatus TaxID=1933044 RepID=UPI0021B3B40B|nr:L-idonate 5-dehydrogenase [Edaphobacter flagellatus]